MVREGEKGTKKELKYARNITIERTKSYVVVRLLNPWKKGAVLHTYYLVGCGSQVVQRLQSHFRKVLSLRRLMPTSLKCCMHRRLLPE